MEIIGTIIGGIVIAAVSSWITVQLSLRRFRQEKWWERRVDAYERVLEALHHSKAFSEVHLNATYESREVPDDRDEELREKSREASREIERATDVGGFLLGDEARKRLKQYQEEAKDAAQTSMWFDFLERDFSVTNSCLRDMIEIAKRDLNIK